MACTDYTGSDALFEFMQNEQFRDAILCQYQDPLGGVTLGLIVWGCVATAMFSQQDSMLLPVIVTLLVGSLVVSQLPSIALGVVAMVLLFVVGLGPMLIIQRYTSV